MNILKRLFRKNINPLIEKNTLIRRPEIIRKAEHALNFRMQWRYETGKDYWNIPDAYYERRDVI